MSSFLYLTLGAIFALLVSRWHKSANVYVTLLCTLLFGFVVGTGIKDAVANASNVPSHELVITDSNHTSQSDSTTVVAIVDNTPVMGYDLLNGDTVITTREEVSNKPTNSEIEDDS